MLAFAIRRLLEATLVMVAVALLAFVLFRFVGDPVNQMVGQDTSLEDRIQLRKDLGLDDPIAVQFGRFIWNAAKFDFGISYQVKQPVTAIIADRFPATLELAVAWRKRGHDLALGVGIAEGYATLGAIGFEGRWDYGAIGTVTNLAARLCAEARGWQILVSSRVAAAVEELVNLEEVGTLTLKGLLKPVPTFNVTGLRASAEA